MSLSKSKGSAYGDFDNTLTYTKSATVNSEVIVLDGALARTAGENVGTYAIGMGTLALTDAAVNANYQLELAAAPVYYTITQRALTLTFDSEFVYNGQSQKPVVTGVEGLAMGDAWETSVNIGWTVGATTDVGSWPSLGFTFTGTAAANYTHATFATTLTITPRPMTLTWYINGDEITTGAHVTYNNTTYNVTAEAGNLIGEDKITLQYAGAIAYTEALSGIETSIVAKTYNANGSAYGNYKIESDLSNRVIYWNIDKANYDTQVEGATPEKQFDDQIGET